MKSRNYDDYIAIWNESEGKISLTQYTGILQPGLSQLFVHPDSYISILGSGINNSLAILGRKASLEGNLPLHPLPPPVD